MNVVARTPLIVDSGRYTNRFDPFHKFCGVGRQFGQQGIGIEQPQHTRHINIEMAVIRI